MLAMLGILGGVLITFAEFLEWAKLDGRSANSEARTEFVGLNLGQRFYD